MKYHDQTFVGIGLVLVTLLAGPPSAGAKEGFGMTKKTATLNRISPPAVFLMGTKIRVEATSAVTGGDDLAVRLKSQLESELLNRDDRLTVDPTFAETLVEIAVLHNEANERWESRKEMASREVGKDAKGKPIYRSYEVTVKYKIVTHSFGATYKVTDLVKNASLDADTIEVPFKGEYREGNNAPELFTLENQAIARFVDGVARRVTPTREQIPVLLPKGSFQDLITLAQTGHWNRYLESVERRPPIQKPQDEAYRQYAVGTAYEALGYAADDPETTLKYLEQADLHYNNAIDANPQEKFFSKAYDSMWSSKTATAPLERVRSALVNYRRLKDFQDNYETMLASADTPASGGKSLAGDKGGEKMDNVAVIRMVKAGLAADIILTAIESAANRAFDTSPNGLIQLSAANVDNKIIMRIQELAAENKSKN